MLHCMAALVLHRELLCKWPSCCPDFSFVNCCQGQGAGVGRPPPQAAAQMGSLSLYSFRVFG